MGMSNNKIAEGRARGSVRTRTILFEDPTWEDRFDCLIRLTQRTQLIKELTGTDVRPARLKEQIDRRLAESGDKAQRPRGLGRRFSSQGFLSTKFERLDAAFLIALHFGSRGPGAFSETETNLGRALDKRLEAYLSYKALIYPNSAEPKVSFETYCVLISGIRARAIEVHTCADCGSLHPWQADQLGQPNCPVCSIFDLKMAQCRREIEARQLQRRHANANEQKVLGEA
jgi:hypothetical protein